MRRLLRLVSAAPTLPAAVGVEVDPDFLSPVFSLLLRPFAVPSAVAIPCVWLTLVLPQHDDEPPLRLLVAVSPRSASSTPVCIFLLEQIVLQFSPHRRSRCSRRHARGLANRHDPKGTAECKREERSIDDFLPYSPDKAVVVVVHRCRTAH